MGQQRKGRRRFPVHTSVKWLCSPTVGLCLALLKGWWRLSLCKSFHQPAASLKLLQVALSVVFPSSFFIPVTRETRKCLCNVVCLPQSYGLHWTQKRLWMFAALLLLFTPMQTTPSVSLIERSISHRLSEIA